jgi:predicted alpha/beta-hydrolase family hydrolase
LKKPSSIDVAVGTSAQTTALVYTANESASAALILGHGAGAGQLSPFMVDFARALSELGLDVVTFNFLYTEQKRKMPDRGPVLEECYRAVIGTAREHLESATRALFIGGKSMGGRIATQVAALDAALPVEGLVLLGYPLHPPGQPHKLRDAHLLAVRRPMLFVQGTRDTFGTPEELAPILAKLTPRPIVHAIDGGDHSFKLSKKDPARQAAIYTGIQNRIIAWILNGRHQRATTERT